ncbi:MAG: phospholipase D-like domain-containing protein [bacterium]|nr:phospholipase D-like domain-containing protein [bacterium]
MKRLSLITYVIFAALIPSVIHSHAPLISELVADPSTYLDRSEWVEIFNNTLNPILIDGWKITDGEGIWTIPSNGYYLYPNGKITLAWYADTFKSYYGYAPDFGAVVGASGARPLSVSGTITLANAGDQVYLKNASDSIIDCFAYVTKYTTANAESVWYPISTVPSTNVSFIRWPENSEGLEENSEVSEVLSEVWANGLGQATLGPDTGGLHPQGLILKNIAQNPGSPDFLDKVIVSCNATSDTTINYVRLYWSSNNFISTDSSTMNKQAGDTTFIDTIPAYAKGFDIRYYLRGVDNRGRTVFSPPAAPASYYRYIVADTGESYFEVHFNKTVDPSLANMNVAVGEDSLDYHLCKYIHNAQKTIDCCFYDFDRQVVADSLEAAHNRGVKIRFITDVDNRSLAQVAQLEAAGITVIDDAFPDSYAGSNIMHNKFCIIDTTFTFTGSWNITDNCTDRNANNSIMIRDRQVAENYVKEFTEMWGSATMTPNSAVSKFSTQKTDNISHVFIVDNDTVKVYMSPSDGCASKLISAISTANSSIYFCIFVFSHQGVSDAMKVKYDAGVDVRGIFDATYWNADYSKSLDMRGLWNTGNDNNPWSPPADVFRDSVDGNLLHHKYMLIDADKWDSNPIVATGSFNWSDAAEDGNDENLVLLHSKYFADLFIQEFAARYDEAGGADAILVDTKLFQMDISARREKENVIISYNIENTYVSSVEIEYNEKKIHSSSSMRGSFVHENRDSGKYDIFAVRESGVREHLGQFYIDSFGRVLSVVSENNLWTKKSPYKAKISGEGIVNVSVINAIGEVVEKKDIDLSKETHYSPSKDISGGIYYIRFTDSSGNTLNEKVLKLK